MSPDDREILPARHPRVRGARRRAPLPAGRLRHRRTPRHRPARRAERRGHDSRDGGQSMRLPGLRHHRRRGARDRRGGAAGGRAARDGRIVAGGGHRDRRGRGLLAAGAVAGRPGGRRARRRRRRRDLPARQPAGRAGDAPGSRRYGRPARPPGHGDPPGRLRRRVRPERGAERLVRPGPRLGSGRLRLRHGRRPDPHGGDLPVHGRAGRPPGGRLAAPGHRGHQGLGPGRASRSWSGRSACGSC